MHRMTRSSTTENLFRVPSAIPTDLSRARNRTAANHRLTSRTRLSRNPVQVEMPFWLTQTLATRNMVSIELPKCFGRSFKRSLLADPRVVDLRDHCFYFYELGLKLSALSRSPDIGDMLQKALSVRYLEIIR